MFSSFSVWAYKTMPKSITQTVLKHILLCLYKVQI